MFSITTILCILITSFIRLRVDKNTPKPTIVEEKELEEDDLPIRKTKVKSQSQLSTLLPLLKKVDVIVFLLLTFIWGMPYAGLDPVCKHRNQSFSIDSFLFSFSIYIYMSMRSLLVIHIQLSVGCPSHQH